MIHKFSEVQDLYQKVTVGMVKRFLNSFNDDEEMWVSMIPILTPHIDKK